MKGSALGLGPWGSGGSFRIRGTLFGGPYSESLRYAAYYLLVDGGCMFHSVFKAQACICSGMAPAQEDTHNQE